MPESQAVWISLCAAGQDGAMVLCAALVAATTAAVSAVSVGLWNF